MTKDQLNALRDAANSATHGPWGLRDDYKGSIYLREQCIARCCEPLSDENARHISAANPQAILQLLDYVEALEKDAARYRWLRERMDRKDVSIIAMRNDPNPEFDEEVDAAIDAAIGEQG